MSNLDAGLRVRTRVELAQLHQRIRTTMIFVTHDQTEAMTLASRIVVMNNRKVEQIGTPMEVWATTQSDVLNEAVASGLVENLGESGMRAKEEWWYPLYMKEACPGLPNWEALLEPDCVAAFSTPETAPKGRYLGAPVTWGGFDEERVEALGLDFEVIHAGTDAALFAELESAYQRSAPIILWIYTPHWVPAVYEGEYVEFPPFTPECYSEESYDCGKPTGPIWKAAWTGLAEKWPTAHTAIRNFQLSSEESNELIRRVDVEKEPLEKVVAEWLDANEARWKAWMQ